MMIVSLLVSCAILALARGQYDIAVYPPNNYGEGLCRNLPDSRRCCTSRQDDCSTPIKGTMCYCDSFCNKHGPNRDCCRDYEEVCEGVVTTPGPLPQPESYCPYGNVRYNPGQTITLSDKCYTCTCIRSTQLTLYRNQLQCVSSCSATGDGCLYNGITYPDGRCVNIGDPCYICTCHRSSYDRVTLKCDYLCGLPTSQPPIYKCQFRNKFWYPGETVRTGCEICTCKQTATGFGVDCHRDPACGVCNHKNQAVSVGQTVRQNCEICTCKQTSSGSKMECHFDHNCPDHCVYNSRAFPVGHRMRQGLQDCLCKEEPGSTPQFCCNLPSEP